jgi:hypothetical protein
MTGFSSALTYDVTCIGAQREERTLQPGSSPPSQPSDALQRPPSTSLLGGAPWTPTRTDRVRDFLAAAALLVSLGLDWDADTPALFRIDVAIVTGLSLLSPSALAGTSRVAGANGIMAKQVSVQRYGSGWRVRFSRRSRGSRISSTCRATTASAPPVGSRELFFSSSEGCSR